MKTAAISIPRSATDTSERHVDGFVMNMTAQQKHLSTRHLGLSTLAAKLRVGIIFNQFGDPVFNFINAPDLNPEWRSLAKTNKFCISGTYLWVPKAMPTAASSKSSRHIKLSRGHSPCQCQRSCRQAKDKWRKATS